MTDISTKIMYRMSGNMCLQNESWSCCTNVNQKAEFKSWSSGLWYRIVMWMSQPGRPRLDLHCRDNLKSRNL